MSEQYTHQRRNLLVVEDHRDTAELVATILEDEGYGVTVVEDAEAAFRVLSPGIQEERTYPDAVLLDLSMPGLSPIEMLRKLGANHVPPVIVMSAGPDYAIAAAAREIGAAAIVRKPFAIEDLINSVKRVLTGRRTED
jgi:DNA-binding response OmpR family regulator